MNVDVVDLGTPDCLLDTTLLFDSFHPSATGYEVIASKYENYLVSKNKG